MPFKQIGSSATSRSPHTNKVGTSITCARFSVRELSSLMPYSPIPIQHRCRSTGLGDLPNVDGQHVGRQRHITEHLITEPGAATAMLNWYRAIRLLSLRTLNLAQVIDVPTLVVWGDRDVALDPICLNGTERYVRDLTVKRLPGVSHWVQQDAPQVVNELLQEFLA